MTLQDGLTLEIDAVVEALRAADVAEGPGRQPMADRRLHWS
jgi:hypothetical protein